jgi:hypothetical protein
VSITGSPGQPLDRRALHKQSSRTEQSQSDET